MKRDLKQILAIVTLLVLIVGMLAVLVAEIWAFWHVPTWISHFYSWLDSLGK